MRSFREIRQDYRFVSEHEQLLAGMKQLMEENADEVMSTLSLWILANKKTAAFFNEKSRQKHVFESQRSWFLSLFSGTYDNRFYERLIRIGSVHVKYKVEPHFMSRSINIMRNTCIGILSRNDDPTPLMTDKIIALSKILDISLDVINQAYFEEEMSAYSSVYKVKSLLIDFSEKYSQAMNLVLMLALIGLSIGVIYLFVQDLQGLFSGSVHIGEGIISALGSVLMLWVMIELMNTEISHLKGGKFHINVFVGVALVTMIRETMIATLRHEKPETIYYLIAAILVVGIVYWLVTRTENRMN